MTNTLNDAETNKQSRPKDQVGENNLYVKRIRYALEAGLLTFFISIVFTIAVITFNNADLLNSNQRIDFYREYSEWNGAGEQEPPQNIIELVVNILIALVATTRDVLIGNLNSITGISRTISIVTVTFFVFIYYRKSLKERLELDGSKAQLDDYKTLNEATGYHLAMRLCFAIATAFGIYVLTSVTLRLLALAFLELSLGYFFSSLVIALIAAAFTALAVFWTSAIDSRETLLLGLGTWVGGLFLSFILVESKYDSNLGHWWMNAISAAGTLKPATSFFSAAFISTTAALIVVWYDTDSLIEAFIRAYKDNKAAPNMPPIKLTNHKQTEEKPVEKSFLIDIRNIVFGFFSVILKLSDGIIAFFQRLFPQAWVENNALHIVRWLYGLIGLGLVLVGIVPVNSPFGVQIFHYAGAIGAAICILLLTMLIPKENYFQAFYGIFSSAYLLILLISLIAFGTCEIAKICFAGGINLTGLELIMLCFVVIWSFATLDGLVYYMNSNWDELQAFWNAVVDDKKAQKAEKLAETKNATAKQ